MGSLLHLSRLAAMMAALCACAPARSETISIEGTARTYAVQLADVRAAPLVIVLHGGTQTGRDMATRTSWPKVARREHFSVVFPDGLNRAWSDLRSRDGRMGRTPPDGTDDVAFIAALVGKFVGDSSADPKRVYVTGISNGGGMTMALACRRADLFAAAASVVMNLTDESAAACHPSRPLPILLMNGTADPLIPYEGGRGSSYFAVDGFWSTERTVQFWRRVNGCDEAEESATDLPDVDTGDGSTVTRIASHCPEGRDVQLYRVNDGGHRMPGSFSDTRFARLVNYMFGPQNHDIDGAETIWSFFKRFPAD
ncbi:MAG: prolyl oligopeptidase family serine peptidase [Bradyrhizobium sp.]|uniref:alpha/beta hydrolase family esterase n=1 Tax=Bradyrhizobium sp. TaxID=376 RepID=UPI001D5F9B43|nr:PHB depolymerase family esterase [Bradyrhizobium sp.]MBV9564074.1 prolyl oligopeptidase family serine peptidase [Bradyrhizobium sp.]